MADETLRFIGIWGAQYSGDLRFGHPEPQPMLYLNRRTQASSQSRLDATGSRKPNPRSQAHDLDHPINAELEMQRYGSLGVDEVPPAGVAFTSNETTLAESPHNIGVVRLRPNRQATDRRHRC